MLCQKNDLSSRPSALRFTTDALSIVSRVEHEIADHEAFIGHEKLLRTVASFGGEAYATHTGYYRRVIRETLWPHGQWVSSEHADFVRGYGYSALGYVWAGFEAMRFLSGSSDWKIGDVYNDALVAESLRGQFGKSSPDGLDRRLAELEDKFVNEYGDENDLVLLCTPCAPVLTAEAALLQDFAVFRGIFPKPPNVEMVMNVSEPARTLVWKFLRRHVRWSIAAAAALYDGLDVRSKTWELLEVKESKMRRERLLSRLPPTAGVLVDAITSLNILNLVLEPSFSFKGCVGLPLGMIFRMVQHVERKPPLDQVGILIGKWNLFTLAQQRSHHE